MTKRLALLVSLTLCSAFVSTSDLTRLTRSAEARPAILNDEERAAPALSAAPQHADPAPPINQTSSSAWRRGAGVALSLVPGVLVSGGGHKVMGRDQEARRLFWLKLSALGALSLSGAAVARSGASEYVTPWGVPLMLASGLSFVSATLLDLTGSLSEPQPQPEVLRSSLAPSLRAGEQGSLSLQGGSRESATRPLHTYWGVSWAQRGARWCYHLKGSGADEQLRVGLGGARALWTQPAWGSWAQLSYTGHLNQRAALALHQLELTSRWEGALGALIGPSLSALRGQLWVGWAAGVISYPLGDVDATSAILGGLTLTHHSARGHLRVAVGYDHRHDGWEGGAVIKGLGSGVLGFAHASVNARVSERLWLGARGAWGAAHLYTINLGWGALK